MESESETNSGAESGSSPSACSALVRAWADHCGLEVDDERVEYGWSEQREIYFAGWRACADEMAKIAKAFRREADDLRLEKSPRAVGGMIVYEDMARVIEDFIAQNKHITDTCKKC